MLLTAPKRRGHTTQCTVIWRSTTMDQEVEEVERNTGKSLYCGFHGGGGTDEAGKPVSGWLV